MKRAILLALALCVTFSSCKASNNSQTVAKVNGEKISAQTLELALKFELTKYDPKISEDADRLNEIKRTILDEMIKDHLLYSYAKKKGISVSENDLAELYKYYKSSYTEATFQKMLEFKGIKYDQWKEDKKREAVIEKLLQQEVVSKIDITDSDIKKYYRNHLKDFTRSDEVHARQIVVEDQKLAESLRERAVNGENFAALAQEFSVAPEGKRGGDLGWFQRGIMPRAFDEACFPLPEGEISPIVKTEFGYHIFKVLERRGGHSEKLEVVKDKIVARLRQQKMEESFDKWYEDIKKRADIDIDKKVLGSINPQKEIKR